MKGLRGGIVMLWRAKARGQGSAHGLQCSFEQLGEGYFELRLRSGSEDLLVEPFDDLAALLMRAERLRLEMRSIA